jgi:hypothetical protein
MSFPLAFAVFAALELISILALFVITRLDGWM